MQRQLLQPRILYVAITAAVCGAAAAIAHQADIGIEGQTLQIQYTIHDIPPWLTTNFRSTPAKGWVIGGTLRI